MKSNPMAVCVAAAFSIALPVQASAVPAGTLTMPQNGQFTLSVSSNNPNMIHIPGDVVSAISGPAGALSDKRLTTSGAVVFTAVADKPFTFYVETRKGQVFPVAATPVKGQGKVYRLLGDMPVSTPEAKAWETAQPYESLLLSLNNQAMKSALPDGYTPVKPVIDGITVPSRLQAAAEAAWTGHALRIDRVRITNPHSYGVTLREQDFWQRGVRSVMFDSQASTLMAGASLRVFIIRDAGGQP
ncbi:type-F conjugative transfer system secretin TraK [Kosakonia sacchari]|uniref:type-F conjugative transfer system secretin TraK n=1 Tax=Kosakonia sacchari TaxID=1158459 RepID=UPI002ACDB915|nr:type-F conjugative transfer system secretin TraK [Kosakonia sacchari]MDZ7324890.1 type-F conjugative transfer system secretin TraK [Kosakonia sacchari]